MKAVTILITLLLIAVFAACQQTIKLEPVGQMKEQADKSIETEQKLEAKEESSEATPETKEIAESIENLEIKEELNLDEDLLELDNLVLED